MSEHTTVAKMLSIESGLSPSALALLATSQSVRVLAKPVEFPNPQMLGLHASSLVGGELRKILDISVGDVIAKGWSTYRELQKYADPAQYPPDETVTCVMGRHNMEITQRPAIDIVVNGQTVATVNFDLTLHIEVEGAILTLRGGKLRKVQFASCSASGELSIEKLQIAKKQLGKIDLPGVIEFEAGIPIRSATSAHPV